MVIYNYSIYVCTVGAKDKFYAFGLAWDQRVDRSYKTLSLPERKDSSILFLLLFFLIISKVYFHDAPNFSEHLHISRFTFMCRYLNLFVIGWPKSLNRYTLLLTDFQMDVIWHDCITILMRLEGDKYNTGWVDLHCASKVVLDYQAPNLHEKEKWWCRVTRSDWGEIIQEDHTCQVKNKTPSSLCVFSSKASCLASDF